MSELVALGCVLGGLVAGALMGWGGARRIPWPRAKPEEPELEVLPPARDALPASPYRLATQEREREELAALAAEAVAERERWVPPPAPEQPSAYIQMVGALKRLMSDEPEEALVEHVHRLILERTVQAGGPPSSSHVELAKLIISDVRASRRPKPEPLPPHPPLATVKK